MKKNDIFEFIAPNGVIVTAAVIDKVGYTTRLSWYITTFLCYSQNRLFTYTQKENTNPDGTVTETIYEFGKVVVEYAILSDYDAFLERYNDIQVAQAETAMGM